MANRIAGGRGEAQTPDLQEVRNLASMLPSWLVTVLLTLWAFRFLVDRLGPSRIVPPAPAGSSTGSRPRRLIGVLCDGIATDDDLVAALTELMSCDPDADLRHDLSELLTDPKAIYLVQRLFHLLLTDVDVSIRAFRYLIEACGVTTIADCAFACGLSLLRGVHGALQRQPALKIVGDSLPGILTIALPYADRAELPESVKAVIKDGVGQCAVQVRFHTWLVDVFRSHPAALARLYRPCPELRNRCPWDAACRLSGLVLPLIQDDPALLPVLYRCGLQPAFAALPLDAIRAVDLAAMLPYLDVVSGSETPGTAFANHIYEGPLDSVRELVRDPGPVWWLQTTQPEIWMAVASRAISEARWDVIDFLGALPVVQNDDDQRRILAGCAVIGRTCSSVLSQERVEDLCSQFCNLYNRWNRWRHRTLNHGQ